jgi:hypothetical protein
VFAPVFIQLLRFPHRLPGGGRRTPLVRRAVRCALQIRAEAPGLLDIPGIPIRTHPNISFRRKIKDSGTRRPYRAEVFGAISHILFFHDKKKIYAGIP